jgi:hypothetical protein
MGKTYKKFYHYTIKRCKTCGGKINQRGVHTKENNFLCSCIPKSLKGNFWYNDHLAICRCSICKEEAIFPSQLKFRGSYYAKQQSHYDSRELIRNSFSYNTRVESSIRHGMKKGMRRRENMALRTFKAVDRHDFVFECYKKYKNGWW